ncbi:MAG: TonB family protein [Bacteroidales bacterium]|nr:TonB family protein [Bacteroidales bacterium]
MKKALVFCIVMCGLFGAAAQNADMNATGLICIEEYGPQFPGGDDSLYSFIQRNIQYPERCHEATGKVYVAFTVETDGSITDAKVLRGICSEYNEEALRIVRMMPRFIPGRYSDGTPVRVTMCLPIVFDFQS